MLKWLEFIDESNRHKIYLYYYHFERTDLNKTNYARITPKCDLGIKQPKRRRAARLIQKCRKYNLPIRKGHNPGFATQYAPEFLRAFKEICEIYAASDFSYPEKQVLILMLDNDLRPCRAATFTEEIVLRLSGSTFHAH